jgi:hypothetical protein
MLSMIGESALWIALVSGGAALLGSLGSQIISALVSLKAKRMETVYSRKADSYKEFLQTAGAFWVTPHNDKSYAQFVHAYFATFLVASEQVRINFYAEDQNVYDLATKMRHAAAESTEFEDAKRLLKIILQQSTERMREDLQKFARH